MGSVAVDSGPDCKTGPADPDHPGQADGLPDGGRPFVRPLDAAAGNGSKTGRSPGGKRADVCPEYGPAGRFRGRGCETDGGGRGDAGSRGDLAGLLPRPFAGGGIQPFASEKREGKEGGFCPRSLFVRRDGGRLDGRAFGKTGPMSQICISRGKILYKPGIVLLKYRIDFAEKRRIGK